MKKLILRILNSLKNRLGFNELINLNKQIIEQNKALIKILQNQDKTAFLEKLITTQADNHQQTLQELSKQLTNANSNLAHLPNIKNDLLTAKNTINTINNEFQRKQFLISNNNVWQFLNGVKIHLPYYPFDYVQKLIGNTNDFYEANILKSLKTYIQKQANILDIGANIGNHSLYFATQMQANKVISFEPIVDTFYYLSQNIKLNNLSNVELYNFALGDENTNAEILDNITHNIGGTSIVKGNGSIVVKRLDDLDLKLEKIDFMKIDVEGFELKVLAGAKLTIAKHKPIVFIKTTNQKERPSLYIEDTESLVKEFFENLDYQEAIAFPNRNFLFLP